ncbi:hypothetical protein [Mamestra brassicae multiple nucleopolyhedrovirus]|uniref:Uncharacterized protein n=1 Tax=Mamestra brassicae nuclear polyhedrosis virus TaxID=78219 RepID=I3XMH4_NPVMB|nr:hypothetical protein [Mamestra brassicae multiple nucleopolyhedrovirus]AFL65007.1 hypothetical protein [Mamestra brassicae multiple nucleopolyhedrovirus]WNA17538.1 hypothetical protein [Alphabaculovirus mabrassicae]
MFRCAGLTNGLARIVAFSGLTKVFPPPPPPLPPPFCELPGLLDWNNSINNIIMTSAINTIIIVFWLTPARLNPDDVVVGLLISILRNK